MSSPLPHNKGDVLELGAWAEALDAQGNVLGLGKLWPGAKQRMAVIRDGLMVKGRITTYDGVERMLDTNPLEVKTTRELWLRWNPDFTSTPPSEAPSA